MRDINVTGAEPAEIKSQTVMSQDVIDGIKYGIFALSTLMFFTVIFVNRFATKNPEAIISVLSAGYVCVIYCLAIYFRYGIEPKNQKHLKAVVDSFANLLALCTLIVTFVSAIYFERAGSLPEMIATSAIGNILIGVITGVLLSRVLFPFWDLYSKYRKV